MRWFRKTKPAEELYDTRIDSNEFRNPAFTPGYKAKLQELRSHMDAWLERVGDKAAIPEAEMVKQMWNGGTEPSKRPTLNLSRKAIR
jgi:N-sulfoglucosamine sulfohydrolase